jgi:ATP-binding cassette subfamily F protein 3
VVEGESPYTLAPGVRGEEEDPEESESDDGETGAPAGTVYRLVKGQLRKLEGGMEQYAEIAARTAAKWAKKQTG